MKALNKIKQKKEGFLDDFLPLFVFILLAAFIILLFCETNAAINQKAKINSIARQYTLKMETKGCLSDDDIKNLVQDLNSAGFTDQNGNAIELNAFKNGCTYSGKGTNGQSVGYGEEVVLSFTVYTEQWIVDPNKTDIWNIFFQKTYNPISISYHSTSKE